MDSYSFSSTTSLYMNSTMNKHRQRHQQDSGINITPDRKQSFLNFVSSLPKRCSPTFLQYLNVEPSFPDSESNQKDAFLDNASVECSSSFADNQATQEEGESVFGWTIDDLSHIYAREFDNEHEMDEFHQQELLSQHSQNFMTQCDEFFRQQEIHPSPPKMKSMFQDDSEEHTEGNTRDTKSFIEFLDTYGKSCEQFQSTAFSCGDSIGDNRISSHSDDEVNDGDESMDMSILSNDHESTQISLITTKACLKTPGSSRSSSSRRRSIVTPSNGIPCRFNTPTFGEYSGIGSFETPKDVAGARNILHPLFDFSAISPISSRNKQSPKPSKPKWQHFLPGSSNSHSNSAARHKMDSPMNISPIVGISCLPSKFVGAHCVENKENSLQTNSSPIRMSFDYSCSKLKVSTKKRLLPIGSRESGETARETPKSCRRLHKRKRKAKLNFNL